MTPKPSRKVVTRSTQSKPTRSICDSEPVKAPTDWLYLGRGTIRNSLDHEPKNNDEGVTNIPTGKSALSCTLAHPLIITASPNEGGIVASDSIRLDCSSYLENQAIFEKRGRKKKSNVANTHIACLAYRLSDSSP